MKGPPLEPVARAALARIDDYADLQGTGYIWYRRRNEETGLENQCWKDSWDSISFRDGRLPGFPGLRVRREDTRGAAGTRDLEGHRPGRASRTPGSRPQATLQPRLLGRRGGVLCARARPNGKKVDALASDNGHLLWSGIVKRSKAKAIAHHLVGRRLFSGSGVRTLAEGEGRYNPIGSHLGTVWPFDNSFIAWGLRRYGFKAEAAEIAAGILDAAAFFAGRLPEAFGGYAREQTMYPVRYPTACSPQAWSTGAPLLLLRTMLGLEPHGEHLVVDPALPRTIEHLELLDLRGRWGRIDAFGRGAVDVGRRRSLRRSR